MKGINFIDGNRIKIDNFENPWNGRDLWHSYLDINIVKKFCKEVNTIIEFGSYDGGDGIKYKYHFPSSSVYSIEASPGCYKNIKPLEKFGLKVYNYAISDKTGELDFYQTLDPNNNNLAPCGAIEKFYVSTETGKNEKNLEILEPIKVPCITIKDFCKKENIASIDLLHVDVEGHAPCVIRGLEDLRPKIIYIEVKSDTHNHRNEIKRLLNENYKCYKKTGSDDIWILK